MLLLQLMEHYKLCDRHCDAWMFDQGADAPLTSYKCYFTRFVEHGAYCEIFLDFANNDLKMPAKNLYEHEKDPSFSGNRKK